MIEADVSTSTKSNQWKLRNMELCWDPVPSANENTGKVQLRLTIFPAKKGHAHKRQDIQLSDPQHIRIVSQNFVNRNVLLIQSDSDYFISTDNKEVLIDWLATIKSALTKRPGDHPLFFISVLPGQTLEPCEALFSIADNTLLLQKPIFEEMFYMVSLSSVLAFGSDRAKLTWWIEVFPQRRSSISESSAHRINFLAVSVSEIISYLQESFKGACLDIEEEASEAPAPGQVQYRVLHPELNDLARIGKQQLSLEDALLNASPHIALAEAKFAEKETSPEGEIAGMPRRITWSGIGKDGKPAATPPHELINQLRKRSNDAARSMNDLSGKDDKPRSQIGSDAADSGPAVSMFGPAGPRLPPPKISPPSSPPPSPPIYINHGPMSPVSPDRSSPTSPFKGRKPKKPPRQERTPSSSHPEGRNSPDYAPAVNMTIAVATDGECIVVPHKRDSWGSVKESPPRNSPTQYQLQSRRDTERNEFNGRDAPSSADPQPLDTSSLMPPAARVSRPASASAQMQGEDTGTNATSETGDGQSNRPVPKPRRRHTGGLTAAQKPLNTSLLASPQESSSTPQMPVTSHPMELSRAGDGTADIKDRGDAAGTPSPGQKATPYTKPAVPVRSDSITHASTSAQLAATRAAAAATAMATPMHKQQSLQPPLPEDNVYEGVEFESADVLNDEALSPVFSSTDPVDVSPKFQRGKRPFSRPPAPPRRSVAVLSGSANSVRTPNSSDGGLEIGKRDSPDGQEADGTLVYEDGVYDQDDEPIYVNLANSRLPVVVDSTDDELDD